MQRIIITGANGSGKSYLAARCHAARPDVPLLSFDAIKLTTDWIQRPKGDIETDLTRAISAQAWVLEGGPSLLSIALPRADAVIWLDPPFAIRAWRLFARPLKTDGTTRPELPNGNTDHIAQQIRFGWKSLRRDAQFREQISGALAKADCPVLACYNRVDTDSAVSLWAKSAP